MWRNIFRNIDSVHSNTNDCNCCGPIWGKLSDKYGRKPILITALAASSITFIIFGLADNLSDMLIARASQGAQETMSPLLLSWLLIPQA